MGDSKPPRGNFTFPNRYRIGCGRRAELWKEAASAGMKRPLVVTDGGVSAQRWFGELIGQAKAAGLEVEVFDGVRGNPDAAIVSRATELMRGGERDGVVAIGGGSAMDVGKCVAMWAGQSGALFDYVQAGGKWKAIDAASVRPLVAMPTTAGTGSECSNGAVITDRDAGIKRTFAHPGAVFMARAVVADPEVTYGLSPEMTAATGMDAVTHCLEALVAPGYHPMAEGVALEGLRLLQENLPIAYREPENAEARTHVLMASSMAAVAFLKGLGLCHAMVHPLGAATDIHHGLGNAILLPYVLTWNRPVTAAPLERLRRYLGLPQGDGFERVHTWILELREELAIPPGLDSVDRMSAELIDDLAEKTMGETLYLATNPRPITASEVRDLFVAAMRG